MVERLNLRLPHEHRPLLSGYALVRVLHGEVDVVEEVPKWVFNIYDPPLIVANRIKARVSIASFSLSVHHDTSLLNIWDCTTCIIRLFPFFGVVHRRLFSFILLQGWWCAPWEFWWRARRGLTSAWGWANCWWTFRRSYSWCPHSRLQGCMRSCPPSKIYFGVDWIKGARETTNVGWNKDNIR